MEKRTMTELIANWSITFGLPVLTTEGFPDKKRIELALRLINEEFEETKLAEKQNNFTEFKDGLGDLLWVTIRAMMECGIDPNDTIERIYISNMSKADFTLEDALKTKQKYLEQGIDTYHKIVNGAYITYRVFDNKVLKSINFKEPQLEV